MRPTCQNCDDRHIGCHAECERYQAFCEYKKRIEKEKRKEGYLNEYCGQRKIKTARIFRYRHN